MGVSYTHGSRATVGSHRRKPLDPKLGVCAECGKKRTVLMTLVGPMCAPTNGSWWHIHHNGATCSVICRIMGDYPPGPFDEE